MAQRSVRPHLGFLFERRKMTSSALESRFVFGFEARREGNVNSFAEIDTLYRHPWRGRAGMVGPALRKDHAWVRFYFGANPRWVISVCGR